MRSEKMQDQNPPTILVCVQGKDEHGIYGMLVCPYRREPEEFFGLGEMILKMDDLCSQALGSSFQWNLQALPSGRRGFLEVLVRGRMNGSLQGLVRGQVTGDRFVGFKSALELMHIAGRIEADG